MFIVFERISINKQLYTHCSLYYYYFFFPDIFYLSLWTRNSFFENARRAERCGRITRRGHQLLFVQQCPPPIGIFTIYHHANITALTIISVGRVFRFLLTSVIVFFFVVFGRYQLLRTPQTRASTIAFIAGVRACTVLAIFIYSFIPMHHRASLKRPRIVTKYFRIAVYTYNNNNDANNATTIK